MTSAANRRIDEIDFGKLGGPVYVGRDKGQHVRARLDLDSVDLQRGEVRVRIPPSTYSVNSSFFLGMFGESIVRLGSSEKFFQHYRIEAPPSIGAEIQSIVQRAITEQGIIRLG